MQRGLDVCSVATVRGVAQAMRDAAALLDFTGDAGNRLLALQLKGLAVQVYMLFPQGGEAPSPDFAEAFNKAAQINTQASQLQAFAIAQRTLRDYSPPPPVDLCASQMHIADDCCSDHEGGTLGPL